MPPDFLLSHFELYPKITYGNPISYNLIISHSHEIMGFEIIGVALSRPNNLLATHKSITPNSVRNLLQFDIRSKKKGDFKNLCENQLPSLNYLN